MKILLIEDEPLAQQRLEQLLLKINPDNRVIAKIDSIESGLAWHEQQPSTPEIDLIIADIQLGDGLSFELLEQLGLKVPVIFVTAYNEHALQAFEHLSIAYLLKPVQLEAMEKALEKAASFNKHHVWHELTRLLQQKTGHFQQRLIVKYGSHIKAIPLAEVACFFVEERVVMLTTFEKRTLAADQNLEQLEGILDPTQFFRINRKVIVNVNAIKNMQTYSRSRVLLELEPDVKTDLVVSTERAAAFKKWLEG